MPTGKYERKKYHRQKLSDGWNDENRKKAREFRLGYKHTEEAKQKMRESWSPEKRNRHREFRKAWRKRKLTRIVRDVGGSLVIGIPSQIAESSGIVAGDAMEIRMTELGIFITKVEVKK